MLVAETCLLLAIRARLQLRLALTDNDCNIVFEDALPATAPALFIAISGAAATTAERHVSSGEVTDMRFSARVTVYKRITDVPRDRRRNLFIDRLTGLHTTLDRVMAEIDNNNELMRAAELLLVDTPAEGGQFPEPFRDMQIDPNPRAAFADPYDAAKMDSANGDPILAICRGVTFTRARFTKGRT